MGQLTDNASTESWPEVVESAHNALTVEMVPASLHTDGAREVLSVVSGLRRRGVDGAQDGAGRRRSPDTTT